jgi:hypothetical protein
MPEFSFPEVKLPDIKWPDSLRDMSRDDIVNAARDVRLPRMSDLPDFDLSHVELPKQIADRLPRRSRPNPILPIAGLVAVAAAIAAAWWLITSPVTGPRIRNAIAALRSRVAGEINDHARNDDVELLSDTPDAHRSSMASDSYTNSNGMPDLGDRVTVEPGEMPEAARSN